MLPIRHPRERGQGFTLRPGADDHHVLRPVVPDVAQFDQGVRRHPQVTQFPGHTHVPEHRAAYVDHLAAVCDGRIQHLLDPVDVRGEAGDDDALPAASEHPVERRRDVPLRGGEPRHLRVGRVDEEDVDAGLAQPGEGAQVGQPTVQWQLVHLEVAGVQQRPRRCPDRDRQGVGDGMVHRDELELERPDRGALTVLHHFAASAADAVLPDLPLEQRQGEFRPEHGDVGPLTQQIWHRTDVVLVSVGQHQADHIVQPVGDRVEARQDEVDTRMVVLGEQHAAIDQQQLAVVLQDRHVAPDVTQPPQRDDAHPTRRQRRWCSKSTGSHADTLLSHMFLRPRASVLALASSIGRSWSPDSLCSDQLLLLAEAGQDEAADTLHGERR